MKTKQKVLTAEGRFLGNDDMHWVVECPSCEREIEYEGFFDAEDLNNCQCGCVFKTNRVYFENGDYIGAEQ